MKSKTILIISRAFHPMNSPRSFRTTELAREFANNGHQVTVLLPKEIESEELHVYAKDNHIELKFFGPLNWLNLEKYKKLGDLPRKIGRLLQVFLQYPHMEIYTKLVSFLSMMDSKYDFVLSIAVPHQIHWAVAKVHSRTKIAKTWIADCGDPFMGNRLDTFRNPLYFNYFENNFLNHADYITVPIFGAIQAYNSKYREKFKVIPQGFNFDGIKLSDFEKTSKTTFAYAGSVSPKGVRSPYRLIDYLLSLTSDFEFHIFSNNAMSLNNIADRSKGRLVLHESIPRNTLIKELSTMDFLVNFDNGLSTASPSKLIDYTLAQRPILNIHPNEPEEKLIEEFLAGDYKNQYVLKDLENYNIKNVAQEFLNLAD